MLMGLALGLALSVDPTVADDRRHLALPGAAAPFSADSTFSFSLRSGSNFSAVAGTRFSSSSEDAAADAGRGGAAVATQAGRGSTAKPQADSAIGTAGEPTDPAVGAEDALEEEEDLLDRHKDYMDIAVQRASQRIDAFFAEDIYEAEYARSQIRLRPDILYREEQGTSYRMRLSAKLNLPNLDERLSLVLGSDTDDSEVSQTVIDDQREPFAGLQLFLKDTEKWNNSISVGVRTSESAVYFGPRVRVQERFNDWSSYRFTQTVRWQTNNNWDIGSRLDLNFLLTDQLFFRQTIYGRWRGDNEEEDGYRTSVGSVLTQRLGDSTGLQYEFRTVFLTQPDLHVDQYLLMLRYRKRTSRAWLYYEINPQVAFEDEFNFQANFGIRLRLELFYGQRQDRRWSSKEDDPDFRW